MSDGALLAQLIGQAAEEGADLSTLRAIAEEAGELGAGRALARLGLADVGAGKDMAELRELLAAWRDAKRSVVKEAAAWVVRLVLALVLVGLAVKLGFWGWVK
ncbi:DUF6127 family protein [Sphingomonas sp. LB-2]|uniref:DUF6127 family protein n=1 Tax=Sphingomonas caeni TaxID=2984949 RepID=UPI0022315E28|nr:DUF6127 family protein [Sphingomonas caeni]MCW3846429.1 DUF6127 family protein [Sphingomonas caeni]